MFLFRFLVLFLFYCFSALIDSEGGSWISLYLWDNLYLWDKGKLIKYCYFLSFILLGMMSIPVFQR